LLGHQLWEFWPGILIFFLGAVVSDADSLLLESRLFDLQATAIVEI
jgi:hypothetical protein